MSAKIVRFTLFFAVLALLSIGICKRSGITTAPPALPAPAMRSYIDLRAHLDVNQFDLVQQQCDQFLTRYPNSDRYEPVMCVLGERLEKQNRWHEVGVLYHYLANWFPHSSNIDRYDFFQCLAYFHDANFKESSSTFEKFVKAYPNSKLVECAQYYVAMSYFLSNDYQKTLESCRSYLAKFPDGRYVGDLQYRLAFIDFNDKAVDQSDKIIRDLSGFLNAHPKDLMSGSLLCLLGDTYKKKIDKAKTEAEIKTYEDLAIDSYTKAASTESMDDVLQYGLDAATQLLQSRKDWKAIGALHEEFIKRRPNNRLALISASWVAKAYSRDGKSTQAAELFAAVIKEQIGDPSVEEVEVVIDELVKSMVPRKKVTELDADALDQQLQKRIKQNIVQENATTTARLAYARARLAQMLKDDKRSDAYLNQMATANSSDPSGLSPALLAVSGDILLKNGDFDGAEKMYKRLRGRYRDSMFSDAGSVGLGYVELARKKPQQALQIFEKVLDDDLDKKYVREATLGKLQALVELNKLESAIQLATEMLGDQTFRGKSAAKADLSLAQVYRKQAAATTGEAAQQLWVNAYGLYQRVVLTYRGFPDQCQLANQGAREVKLELLSLVGEQETNQLLDGNHVAPRPK